MLLWKRRVHYDVSEMSRQLVSLCILPTPDHNKNKQKKHVDEIRQKEEVVVVDSPAPPPPPLPPNFLHPCQIPLTKTGTKQTDEQNSLKE